MKTKDEAVDVGFSNAKLGEYKKRRVLRDKENDIYYSGWMDCFEWIEKSYQEKVSDKMKKK